MGRPSGTLTKDQRWLCYAVTGWQMLDCLIDPKRGISALMTSMSGSTNGQRRGEGPEWLRGGFRCAYGVITSGLNYHPTYRGEVVVTTAQLTAFAVSLPAHVIADLRQCRASDDPLGIGATRLLRRVFGIDTIAEPEDLLDLLTLTDH